jgi:hypothetical protein
MRELTHDPDLLTADCVPANAPLQRAPARHANCRRTPGNLGFKNNGVPETPRMLTT